jgi:hypothetical protein
MRLTFKLYSNQLRKLATVVVLSKHAVSAMVELFPVRIGVDECKSLLGMLRAIPSSDACVIIHTESINTFGILNDQPKFGVFNMDIFNSLHSHIDKEAQFPLLMIAPIANDIREDGMMVYRTVEKLSDLLDPPKPNEVVLFREDQHDILECLCAYPALFGVDIVVVSGIPGTTYTPEFESKTWDKARLAYHSVVNDLIEVQRRIDDSAAEVKASSVYGGEQSKFVRKTGNIKEFNDFEQEEVSEEEEANERGF